MTKRIAWLATASLLPFVCGGIANAETAPAPTATATAPTATATATEASPSAATHQAAATAPEAAPTTKPTPAEKAQAAKDCPPHKMHHPKKAHHHRHHVARHPSELDQVKAQLNAVLQRLQYVETCYQKAPVPPCPPQVCPGECPPAPVCCPNKPMVVLQDGRQGISLTDWITDARYNCIRVHLSAQINKAAWLATNGHRANLQVVDNNASSTRFTLWMEGDLSPCVTVGGVISEEIDQNSTRDTDIDNASNFEASPTTRKAELYVDHKDWGTLFVGHGYMASYLTMEDADYSGTRAANAGEKVNLLANSVVFFNKTTGEKSTGLAGSGSAYTVGKVFDNCDGLSRQDRIRFDSKSVYGFSLQGSYAFSGPSTMWDVGFRYADTWGNTKVGVDVFYEQNNASSWRAVEGDFFGGTKTNARYRQINGSAGVLFENGISLFAAGAYRKWSIEDAHNAWLGFAKLGYQTKFFCEGITAFSVQGGYWRNFFVNSRDEDTIREKTKGTSWGATVVQYFDRVNTELYLTGQTYKLKVNDGDLYKPVTVGLLGARISF